MEKKLKNIILVDGNALMYRSFFGVKKGFEPLLEKMSVGMIYGFCATILNAIDFFRPEILVVTFDTKAKTFRHKIFENYKAQREKAPDEFYAQIPLIFEFLAAAEIPFLKKDGFESDDLIGTLAKKAEKKNFSVKILSGDLDFLQLVSEKIILAKFNGRVENSIFYGPREVHARFGLPPEKMIEFKSIVGDGADNFRGVAGVGPKTAAKILKKFPSLEKIFENIEKISPPHVREKFLRDRENAFLCRKLAKIKTDIPLDFPEKKFSFAENSTKNFLEKMKFSSLQSRFSRLVQNYFAPPKIKKEKKDEQLALF